MKASEPGVWLLFVYIALYSMSSKNKWSHATEKVLNMIMSQVLGKLEIKMFKLAFNKVVGTA